MSWIYRNKWYIGGAIFITLLGVGLLLRRNKTKGSSGGGLFSGGVSGDKWTAQKDYWMVGNVDLKAIGKSVGISMSQNTGFGGTFSDSAYKPLKEKSSIYWAVYDINRGKTIAKSGNADQNVYGASVSKAVVVGGAYDNNSGTLPSSSDVGKAIKLLVKSDNSVWDDLGRLAGGDEAVNKFSDKQGYNGMKPARRKGNQINAVGMNLFWRDVVTNRFKGAESVFKITSSCQTSNSRSRKYIPKAVLMGSKTGTYMSYNHDSAWLKSGDNWYAISVLTTKSDGSEAVALMFGGLFKEYCK